MKKTGLGIVFLSVAGLILYACGSGGGSGDRRDSDRNPPARLGIPPDATTRVSVDSNGNQSTTNASSAAAISSNGRYVVFESAASDLVSGDTNTLRDIFVHDRDADNDGIFDEVNPGARATVRVSVDSNGNQSTTNASSAAAISSNGRYVVFESAASDLVSGDTNTLRDIFVHDRDADNDGIFDEVNPGARATVRVSVDSNGNQSTTNASSAAAISSGARYVVFQSAASDLVTGDNNGLRDIFVRDRDNDEDGIFDESAP